jgi:hypothetical protein
MLAYRGVEPQRARTALGACDPGALASALEDQQLLGLLGSRALAAWGEDAPTTFAARVAERLSADRARSLALEAISVELVARLEAAGVRALVLKGPLLARRLHGDAAYRASNDVDLLVAQGDLEPAARSLAPMGYVVEQTTPLRSHGLPDLHAVLRSARGGLPRIDLHWRIHWYEDAFSADLLARSRQHAPPFLEPEPFDDLAALTLLYARDGFYGLRKAVDIAAWCDGHVGADQPLARHWLEYPPLRPAFAAAALAAEHAVGVSAATLLPNTARIPGRSRLAANLASWNQVGDIDQLAANVAIVDALLSPPRELRHFARRELFVSRTEIESMYGLPSSARRRVTALRVVHAPKVLARHLAGLWSAFRPPRGRYLGERSGAAQ